MEVASASSPGSNRTIAQDGLFRSYASQQKANLVEEAKDW